MKGNYRKDKEIEKLALGTMIAVVAIVVIGLLALGIHLFGQIIL